MKNQIFTAALAVALLAGTTAETAAQELRSSYFMKTSTFRHQINPALLTETYTGMPFLGNLNIGAQGNVGLKNFVYKLDGNPNYDLTTFMNPEVSASEFLGDLGDKNRINIHLNENIFSTAFSAFGGLNLVELNLRSNTHVNLPYELFEFMKTTGSKDHYSLKDLGLRTQNYAELAFGHSRKVMDNLTVGAKVKFLLGIYNADFHVNNMQLTMSDDKWAVSGEGEFSNAGIVDIPTKLKTKDVTNDRGEITGQETEEELDFDNIETGSAISGFGMAFDFGATYKVREDLELSLALLDLGWISYKNATQATMAADPWEFDGFHDIPFDSDEAAPGTSIEDQIDNLEDELEDLFQMKVQGKDKHTKALGATLNIGALYTLPYYDKLKFGFLESTRINGRYSWSEGRFSANIAPVKCFDASISYAVSSFGHSFGWVANVHTKGFSIFLGSNHQFFNITPQVLPVGKANMNLSIGISFPFGNIQSL